MQVDGFRFDIMGHLMLSSMKKIQAALAELTLERDGVDGKSLYIYGEAWDFGEVSRNLCRLVNVTWSNCIPISCGKIPLYCGVVP